MSLSNKDFQDLLDNVVTESLTVLEIMDLFANVTEDLDKRYDAVKSVVLSLWKDNDTPDVDSKLEFLKDWCVKDNRNNDDAEVVIAFAWLVLYADPKVRLKNHKLISQFYAYNGQMKLLTSIADSIVLILNEELTPIPTTDYVH